MYQSQVNDSHNKAIIQNLYVEIWCLFPRSVRETDSVFHLSNGVPNLHHYHPFSSELFTICCRLESRHAMNTEHTLGLRLTTNKCINKLEAKDVRLL
jgi:hypothetical protein